MTNLSTATSNQRGDMDIMHDGTVETRYYVRGIEFTDGEPLETRGYANQGKRWLPDSASAKWNHGSPITRIGAAGYLLKKDGTPGKVRHEQSFVTPASSAWGRTNGKEAPEWLLALFADSQHTD